MERQPIIDLDPPRRCKTLPRRVLAWQKRLSPDQHPYGLSGVNREGLTRDEWMAAAASSLHPDTQTALWWRGEDPTEYRA